MAVKLPEPRIRDGQAAEAQRAALREVAGSDQRLEEMVRKSVTAPYIIKVHDVKAGNDTIRVVDLWFVVYADIGAVDPAKEAAKTDDKEVEAGNMVMRTRLLKPEDLRAAGIAAPSGPSGSGPETWYVHIHGRLLDRIEFDATNRSVATRTGDSIVVASRTDPAFDKPGPLANGWRPVAGGQGVKRPAHPRSRTRAASATRRSAAWRSSRGPCWSRCTRRSSSRTTGSRARRSCGRSSASSPQDQIRRLRRELERRRPS